MQLTSAAPKTLPSKLIQTPDGVNGVKQTLVHMQAFVKQFKKDMRIRQQALSLTKNLMQKDWHAEIKSLFNFVKYEIRYIKDIAGVETLQTPPATLELKQGDCDDKSTLLASLLESIGYKTRFVAVGFDGENFSHVFVQVKLKNRWISLETTEPVNMGWTAPNVLNRIVIYN